ncbi:MAG: hypothetical protein AB1423_15930, partial [Pseudomonadota bacterium]
RRFVRGQSLHNIVDPTDNPGPPLLCVDQVAGLPPVRIKSEAVCLHSSEVADGIESKYKVIKL